MFLFAPVAPDPDSGVQQRVHVEGDRLKQQLLASTLLDELPLWRSEQPP